MRAAWMRRWFVRGLVASVILMETHLAVPLLAAESQKQVLVLYSTRRDAQIAIVGDRELPQFLDDGLVGGVDFYSEYVDEMRFPDAEHQAAVYDLLRLKYQDHRFDVVIAMDHLAVEFVARNRDQLFADTPVVFFANNADLPNIPNATGIIAGLNLGSTLALATQLQPDIRNVFFVTGAALDEDQYERIARVQFAPFTPRLAITYLTGLPTKDLEARLAALPSHSIVYYAVVNRDGAGENFNPLAYLDRLVAVANAPTYSWVDSAMDHGIVGGSLKSQHAEVEAVSRLALRVLHGEEAGRIPIDAADLNVMQVDWRQLRRWGISEARVPAGVTVLFRQPTAFEQYGNYIVGAVTLIVVQAALIGGLVIQRRRRRIAEESLRESEQNFRTMADTAPVMVWRTGTDKRCDFFNLPWLIFRGRILEEELGYGWAQGVHPDDYDHCMSTFHSAFDRHEPFRMEYRLQRADGEYRWVLDIGVPRHLPDGTFNGYIGSCLDITERRHAEEALRSSEANLRASNAQIRDLAGRLITAQEEERSRIARDLHDDISQQAALLTMDLSILRDGEGQGADRLASEAVERAIGLARSIHDLSHSLHPAKLRTLGLVAALDGLLHELPRRDIDISFAHDNIPSVLPPNVTLCLFRIVQEGLQNALKHSRAREVTVNLRGGPDVLTLNISDDGIGFDVDNTGSDGLGLLSMSERLEAVGGTLEIHSTPGAGTRLNVTVPFEVRQRPEVA